MGLKDSAKRVDVGNFDWLVHTDEDGRKWISPSIGWSDGEVYEWCRSFKDQAYNVFGFVP